MTADNNISLSNETKWNIEIWCLFLSSECWTQCCVPVTIQRNTFHVFNFQPFLDLGTDFPFVQMVVHLLLKSVHIFAVIILFFSQLSCFDAVTIEPWSISKWSDGQILQSKLLCVFSFRLIQYFFFFARWYVSRKIILWPLRHKKNIRGLHTITNNRTIA